MGIGNELIGDLEHLLVLQEIRRRTFFRMRGAQSQCWRAEREIEQMHPGMGCLLLPSATVGLSLILEALRLEAGQEVLITPFGWLSNWSCIRRAGLVPRFLPLNDDLQLEPSHIAARITNQTAAVVVTHLLGRGQQAVQSIAQLCCERNVILLEDIAQSFGVLIGNQRAGTFGEASWCSLNHHKILSTGDGGFVLVREEALFARLSALHDQGCVMKNGKRVPAPLVEPGLSLRVNELTGAVLRAQLARFHLIRGRILAMHAALAEQGRRRLNLDLIEPHSGDLPFTVMFRRTAEMRYPSLLDSGWHVAGNVPWLAAEFENASRKDPIVGETAEKLARTSAIGSGFVDPYYAVPVGLQISDALDRAPKIIDALEKTL